PVTDPDPNQQLLAKEARFWDLQEEKIDSLYARPHDWRFVPKLAEVIIRPRIKTFLRLLETHRQDIGSLVDIGCGNGWLCHATAKRGIRSIGIDLSPKKIATAQRMAHEQGVAHLCEFVAGDVMTWRPAQKVDLLTSHGSLHHFPAFADALDHMVEHHLRPRGYMLFIEPNHEGMAPEVAQFLLRCAKNPLLRRCFDIDFYLEVTGKKSVDAPDPTGGDEMNVRHESPAGKEFFGEHIHLDDFFREHFDVIERHFYHYFSSHATNAFYVFMKSRLLRLLWRLALPLIVRRDTRLLRDPKYQQYAEDGLWFMRPRPR
ncbi:MAG TPA: class I SAM-dependent methyltransferase, partial [Xanthomonadales bacterium]|nr:class I SAM-dependent methyltransferase [Xanthomonadales bacterium]